MKTSMKVDWRVLRGKVEIQEHKTLISQMLVMEVHPWRVFCWKVLCSKSMHLKCNVDTKHVQMLSKFGFSRSWRGGSAAIFISNKLPFDINKYHFAFISKYILYSDGLQWKKQIYVYHNRSVKSQTFGPVDNDSHPELVLYELIHSLKYRTVVMITYHQK